MEQDAAADVFASADQRWMTHAKEHDLVAGAPTVFASNRLVAIVPRANPGRIGSLGDLARRGVKLVLAAEAVPAGRYSREALQNLRGAPGFPPDYDKQVLANVVSEEDNVKAVVAKVQLGEADAGVVYRSDVTPAVSTRVRIFEIADPYNVLARYPIALTSSTAHSKSARAFVELVESPMGQRVLAQHGFLPAGEPVRSPAARP
jgi:molybdate transport system substrate-binding protein